MKRCLNCDNELQKYQWKYCCNECNYEAREKRRINKKKITKDIKYCLSCDKPLETCQKKYCSRECAKHYHYISKKGKGRKTKRTKCFVCKRDVKEIGDMYCSTTCHNKHQLSLKKLICVICGKPSKNAFCGARCKSIGNKVEYISFCLKCGKEIINSSFNNTHTYCSKRCNKSTFLLNENIFLQEENVNDVYKALGFLFGSGAIDANYAINTVRIKSTKELLLRFNEIIGSNSPLEMINNKDNDRIYYETSFRSEQMINYLSYIGLTTNLNLHSFPTILDKY